MVELRNPAAYDLRIRAILIYNNFKAIYCKSIIIIFKYSSSTCWIVFSLRLNIINFFVH